MSEKVQGTIIRCIDDRGFGFVRDRLQKEHFFHFSDTDFIPAVGLEILFSIGYDKLGRTKAINIERANPINENSD